MAEFFDSLRSLEDVRALIDDHIRETEVLEYKTASAVFSEREKQEIAKDVSAMANSLDGVIVFGVSTSPTDKTLPVDLVPIEPKNIESLDRVINSQIRPPIHGLRRKVFPPDAPKILVLEVPSSEDPPHQNLYDKRYYRRSGRECLPMEHDLIALKFGRELAPILDLVVQPLAAATSFTGDPPWSDRAHLRLLIRNDGRRIGRHVSVILKSPSIDFVRIFDRKGTVQNIDALYPGFQARQFSGDPSIFHPGIPTSVVELEFSFAETFAGRADNETLVDWTLIADEMEPRRGEVSMKDLGWAA